MLTSIQNPENRLNRFRVDRQKLFENDVKTIARIKNFFGRLLLVQVQVHLFAFKIN